VLPARELRLAHLVAEIAADQVEEVLVDIAGIATPESFLVQWPAWSPVHSQYPSLTRFHRRLPASVASMGRDIGD